MSPQRLRRGFPEKRPVLQGKATELVETVVGRNGGDGGRLVAGVAERLPDALQPLVQEIALRALPVDICEGVAPSIRAAS